MSQEGQLPFVGQWVSNSCLFTFSVSELELKLSVWQDERGAAFGEFPQHDFGD